MFVLRAREGERARLLACCCGEWDVLAAPLLDWTEVFFGYWAIRQRGLDNLQSCGFWRKGGIVSLYFCLIGK